MPPPREHNEDKEMNSIRLDALGRAFGIPRGPAEHSSAQPASTKKDRREGRGREGGMERGRDGERDRGEIAHPILLSGARNDTLQKHEAKLAPLRDEISTNYFSRNDSGLSAAETPIAAPIKPPARKVRSVVGLEDIAATSIQEELHVAGACARRSNGGRSGSPRWSEPTGSKRVCDARDAPIAPSQMANAANASPPESAASKVRSVSSLHILEELHVAARQREVPLPRRQKPQSSLPVAGQD
jgi:hypothetical protein